MLARPSPASVVPSLYQYPSYLLPQHLEHYNSLSYTPPSPPLSHSEDQLMSGQSPQYSQPAIRLQKSSPFSAADQNAQQMLVQQQFSTNNWGRSDALLNPSAFSHQGLSQQRFINGSHHKRDSSASSVASAGPPSPRDTTTIYPRIAGSDASHFSPSAFDSIDFFASARGSQMPKSLPTPVDTPTQQHFHHSDYQQFSPHDPRATTVMRRLPQNRSPNKDDDGPYSYSGPHSVSSVSHHDSPATPQTASYDGDFGEAAKGLQNTGAFNAQLGSISHGMNAGNYDDVYNNPQLQSLTPQQQQMIARAGGLSPYRTSLANRFQAAQLDHVSSRGSSPAHSIQREKSPFKQGSQYDHTAHMQAIGSQRLGPPQMTSAQFQQHHALNNAPIYPQQQQQRPQQSVQEEPKTVSPKDVELDYHDEDQAPLFPSSQQSQFSLPREESNFSTSSAFGQPGQYYTTVPTSSGQSSQFPFLGQQHRQQSSMRTNADQSLPDFPAHLASMETTVSSESGQEPQTPVQLQRPTPIARPRDTSADVGVYSCTFHGCSQRFDSPIRLQKHKKEFHRQVSPSASNTASALPSHSTSTHGHVASASTIASRNAQSGPHTCERVNPTTGKPCNSVFSRPYDLTRHEDTIHSGRKQKVRCHLCTEDKTFSRNDALTRHMRVVHPDVDWPGKTRRKARD